MLFHIVSHVGTSDVFSMMLKPRGRSFAALASQVLGSDLWTSGRKLTELVTTKHPLKLQDVELKWLLRWLWDLRLVSPPSRLDKTHAQQTRKLVLFKVFF